MNRRLRAGVRLTATQLDLILLALASWAPEPNHQMRSLIRLLVRAKLALERGALG